MSWSILSTVIKHESDVIVARQRAKQIASLLGFDNLDQTRIATAISEIARSALNYADGSKVEFRLEGRTVPQVLLVQVQHQGLRRIQLPEQNSAKPEMDLGLVSARRLMSQLEVESSPEGGLKVRLKKLLPKRGPLITATSLQEIAARLAEQRPQSPLEEVQQQNQELLHTLEELGRRQEELLRLNRELEDTNRGVVALYAELDEQAGHLRRADEMKSHFLSNMSHEFRTPLNSILALSRLLLDRTDGDLTSEQEKQAHFIRKSAEGLSELVNDLLDLAKIEAGKVVVHPAKFEITNLFSALRGMLKPLLLNEAVNLVFEEPQNLPTLYTDEGKVSQILRNFISNALKFTERGEVRVSAILNPKGDEVTFSVADTGIGIAPENQARIFEEFIQLEHPLQRQVKGTGLGLPLCYKLATLLGGSVSVQSQPGLGSTFSASIPIRFVEHPALDVVVELQPLNPQRMPILVVEDEVATQLVYEKFLKDTIFQIVPARTIWEGQQLLPQIQPKAIVLDILLPGEDAWSWLAELKGNDTTRHIPVLIVTTVEDQRKGLILGADAYGVKPIERQWLLEQLTRLVRPKSDSSLLVIDDEETGRYLLKKMLAETTYFIDEAPNGLEGLRQAREKQPEIIFLDLMMPDLSGFEVLAQLKADPSTQAIPVIAITSKTPTGKEERQLAAQAQATLSKAALSREAVLGTLRKITDKAS